MIDRATSLRGESNDRRELDSTKQSLARAREIASLDSSGPELQWLSPLKFLLAMTVLLTFVLLGLDIPIAFAQLAPSDLTPDSYVKLILNDSSQFYVNVLGRPLPDRIIVETKYGRLEIPLARIASVIDYRYNWVEKENLMRAALKNEADDQKYAVTKFLAQPKLSDTSTVVTKDFDVFKGHRYLFDDSAHVILSTAYGDLFFKYPDLQYVDNWSGQNDRREDFSTALYSTVTDPLASQDFLLPTARSFGQGNLFLTDYMIAGLQISYGVTDWLSLNAGGLFLPFLPTTVTAATGGLKITPFSAGDLTLAAGFQDIYSRVTKASQIAFPYIVATYGTWESEVTLLGGISYQCTTTYDSLSSQNVPYYPVNSFIGAGGDMRVGENLKASIELYFIGDFGIVPTVFSVRYFENNFTIDASVVFSLYKAGASNMKTLGEYVFNAAFDVVPM